MNHGFLLLALTWVNDRGLPASPAAPSTRDAAREDDGLRLVRSHRRRRRLGGAAAQGNCGNSDCLRTTSTGTDILQLCLGRPQYDAKQVQRDRARARSCQGEQAASKARAGLRAALCVIALAAAALACPAAACAQTRSTPQPPPRPAGIGQPSTQQPLQPQSQAPAAAKPDEPLDLDHPPMLPSASRERMSACGREWQAVKKAGKDIDIGWRAFATRCLTR